MKIKALRTITDQGHNIARGKTADVADALADAWLSLGWAELVKSDKKAADGSRS